jgi:hypothetical protein
MTVLVPNTFQNRVGTTSLKDLDANFTALADAINTGAGAATSIFDGGYPSTVFTAGSTKLDAGGVT